MNWMRGLLRLWAVISLIWISFVLVLTQPWNAFFFVPTVATATVMADPENRFAKYLEAPVIAPAVTVEQAEAINSAQFQAAAFGAARVAFMALVAPALLLLMLLAGRWVALGFRRAEGK